MILALIFSAAVLSVSGQGEDFASGRMIGDQLDFVERNVLNLLRIGTFPQFYNSSYPLIRDCGCYYSPTKIMYGTRVGLQCQRQWEDENPPYDADNCGIICNDPHGIDIVMYCPAGWDSDCAQGCYPPDSFETVEDRVDFWELTLTSLMMYGRDYIGVAEDYLKSCGCEGKVRPIRYGTSIGFDCLMGEDAEPEESCSAVHLCMDDNDRRIVTFCPAGHTPTCAGCEKQIEDETLESRLRWMINVITGYARESLELLNWTPTSRQALACACAGAVEPVEYGNRLGYWCKVHSVDAIQESCGPNVLCENSDGDNLLHFCPDGFSPSCSEGCTFPWSTDKEEL